MCFFWPEARLWKHAKTCRQIYELYSTSEPNVTEFCSLVQNLNTDFNKNLFICLDFHSMLENSQEADQNHDQKFQKIHPRTTPKPHLRLHKSPHIFFIYDGLMRQTHNHRQVETCRKSQWTSHTRCYADFRRSTHLDMAPKSVVAVKLTHFSIAGLFHFSINENVPGEQGHFSTHVDPIHDLSDVMILRLPWRDNTSGISVTGYDNVNYSREKRKRKKKKWKGSIASCELVTNVHYNV